MNLCLPKDVFVAKFRGVKIGEEGVAAWVIEADKDGAVNDGLYDNEVFAEGRVKLLIDVDNDWNVEDDLDDNDVFANGKVDFVVSFDNDRAVEEELVDSAVVADGLPIVVDTGEWKKVIKN